MNRMLLSWGKALFLVCIICVIQGQEKEDRKAELFQRFMLVLSKEHPRPAHALKSDEAITRALTGK